MLEEGMLLSQEARSHSSLIDTPDRHYIQNSRYKPCLIVLGGATATGKTGLALALAQRFPLAVLSADSRLVYRELDIGTAKPTPSQRSQVPHYLIDLRQPTETLTVAEYQREAQALIHTLHSAQQQIPLLVGGTGLYISAIVDGLQIPPVAPQPDLRSQLVRLGQPHCYDLLQQVDAVAAARIHPHDAVRTIRALEVAYVTGQPLSAQQGQHPPKYPVLYLGLTCDRATLQQRIAERTALMLEQGFVEEVAGLRDRYGADLPLLKTLGYAEILGYLAGEYPLAEAIELINYNTRQFAKRQQTWFRKRAITWFDSNSPTLVAEIEQTILKFLSNLP